MRLVAKKIIRIIYYCIAWFLFYTGFLTLYLKKKLKSRFLIVFYHEVNETDALGNIVTRPKCFKNQIKYLSRHFKPVSIKDIENYYTNNCVNKNSVLISFDGGYKGNILYAYPILKEYNTPGLIYIVTESIENAEVPWTTKLSYILNTTKIKHLSFQQQGTISYNGNLSNKKKALKEIKAKFYKLNAEARTKLIDDLSNKLEVNFNEISDTFMNWNDVADLNQSTLIDIGSHTITHPRLNSVNTEEVKREIYHSKELIENKLGDEISSFCYPDGKINEETAGIVKNSGYKSATTTINGLNSIKTNPYLLKRIGGGNMPLCVFALKMSGLFKKLNI